MLDGAPRDREIIFTRTLESLNLVASSLHVMLKPGDDVVISIMEYHSNLIPGSKLRPNRRSPLFTCT